MAYITAILFQYLVNLIYEIGITFPESIKAEFKDLDSYRLKKNVLLEIAHYLNEVITELVIPKINI